MVAAHCPLTQTTGKRVRHVTLEGLLHEAHLPMVEGHEWYFCGDPKCDVVYFTADGKTLSKDSLKVRVGLKENASPRPLCYCFGHSFEDVERAVAATGTSSLADEITEKCRQGLDRCEETNPQGSCCLGNVRRATKDAQARTQRSSPARGEDDHDCCNAQTRKEKS
jgi:hypothetical protein